MHMAKYDFRAVEQGILKFWKENNIHARSNSEKGKNFYFLDGPPYTSGRVHIGTAWNKCLKDLILRYKRLRGYNVWDRAGYDMHGMPTEQGTERELGIKSKDEIEKMGVDRFVSACREFSERNLLQMNEDFRRLGVWMDFDDPYMPVKNEYIEGEWWLIKKAHENNRLYEGERTMTWCARCQTALAKHELEYEQVSDESIFLKFSVQGKKGEYLIIWTTTPWTIPFNLAVMVNPGLEYVRARVEGEVWIVAKGLAGAFIGGVAGKKYEVVEEFSGKKLAGLRYLHPLESDLKTEFDKFRNKSQKVHTVVLSEEYVDLSAGTGLVHMAPGCGPEDYEVGHREGILPFNELSEAGVFSEKMGRFSGHRARADDKKFISALDETGLLVAKTRVDHDYAHCWRCKKPVVYRTTTQWFFKIEDLKERMQELNRGIQWVPDFAGSRNFDNWLANLRDNGITRQRYWGTPLPVWKCAKCKNYVVIGSMDELREKAGSVPGDLHKPWIDEVKIKCSSCSGVMHRIPDILDVWIDAGSASWNCLGFPQKTELFERLFPADFILEGIDQIRGWFNLLFVASMVSMQKPSFRAVYMHGFVQDSLGRKMSKSLGNYILPQEVVDKYGADTLRYYMIGGASPGVDINYNFDDMKLKHRNLVVLWNLHNWVLDMARSYDLKPGKIQKKDLGHEERHILSRMNSQVRLITQRLDEYVLNEAPAIAEQLFLDLSRGYIQLVREKASGGTAAERQLVFDVVYEVLMASIRIFSVTCPMITEQIYQSLRSEFGLEAESIFMLGWPVYDEKAIDEALEKKFEIAGNIIQSVMSLREKVGFGLRWPLAEVVIQTNESEVLATLHDLAAIICQQANVKGISLNADCSGHEKTEWKGTTIALSGNVSEELLAEGYAREIMRRVQNLRKKSGLKKNDEIILCIVAGGDIERIVGPWLSRIKERVGARSISICEKLECKMHGASSVETIRKNQITLCLEKVE